MRGFFGFLVLWGFCFADTSILQDRVGVKTFLFQDETRNRPVAVEVWYPVTEEHTVFETALHRNWVYPSECREAPFSESLGKRPLVLFSHGLGSDRRERIWFAEKLVKEGFLVASIDHFQGTWDNLSPQEIIKIWERPLDISFALTALLENPFWGKWIDEEKIGFSGYSLGGGTGLFLAGAKLVGKEHFLDTFLGLPPFLLNKLVRHIDFSKEELSFQDPRIKAFFLMAPCTWGIYMDSLKNTKGNMHIVALERDSVLPTHSHGKAASYLVPECRFSLMRGNFDHYIFLNQITEEGKESIPSWIYTDAEGVDRESFHEKIAEMGKQFFLESLFQNK